MAELKTRPTKESLDEYLARVDDPDRRKDCAAIAALMREVTGESPVMWGTGIVGFGRYRYNVGKKSEAEWPITGFAARKTDLTLYIMPGVESFPDLLPRLGKFKHGKSCLYIKRLSDVDMPTLKELVTRGVAKMQKSRVE
jgi:hypothetical protein